MSLARVAGALPRLRPASATITLRSRYASSHSDHHDHHDHGDHAQDAVAYPKEDFFSGAWRNFVLFGLGVVAFYKFAPEPSENTVIARFIQHYRTPAAVWQKLNFRHLEQTVESADDVLLVTDAKLPPVHRFRYTQRFEQHSAFLQPVGMNVSVSDVVVKGDK